MAPFLCEALLISTPETLMGRPGRMGTAYSHMTFVAHAQMRGLRGTCKEVPNGVHAPCAPVTPPIHSKVMPTGACPCGEQPHGWCATWVPEPRGPNLPNNGAQLGLIIIGNHSASLVAVAAVHLLRSAPSPPPY